MNNPAWANNAMGTLTNSMGTSITGNILNPHSISNTVNPYTQSAFQKNSASFTVEKVDNGYILRVGQYEGGMYKTRICKDMDELRDLFVASMVEIQLES